MLTVVVGAAAALALYPRINDEICRHVEAKIAEHYPGLDVSLRWAELVEGKGIRVRDLLIAEPGAEGPHAELLYVEEILFECSTDWKELLQGDPTVRRVWVRRPKLCVTRQPDATWSAAKLLPPPQFGDHPPEVTIESGVIEIFDPLKTPASTLTLHDVNLSLTPATGTPVLQVKNGHPERSEGTGKAVSHVRQLKGTFAGDGFRRVEVTGWVDPHAKTFSIRGRAEGVEFSPELRDSLPGPLNAKLPVLDLRGAGDLQFEARYDPTAILPLKYDLSGRLVRGRIDDARLPQPLTEIRANVHVDNGGYTIEDFSARSGQAALRMACRRTGFESDSPLRLTAEVRQLNLDRALLNILPPLMQEQWYKYCPAGKVDADVELSFDGKTWRPEVSVRCLNVSFTHHKFPYRLEYGKGTLDLKDDRLHMNLTALTAYGGSQPVRLSAETLHPFNGPTGWFEAKGDEIEIDEALLAALPEKPAKVVRSLNPRGTINFYVRIRRDKPNEPIHKHLLIAANHCSIRYERFPYPISDIRGRLEMFDSVWTFRDLEGTNDKARITCEGGLAPGLQGKELVLNLVGHDVALKEDLRNALSPHIQQVWHDLQPRGAVDLSAEIRYLSEQKQFSIGVRAEPQPENASIKPVHFPYRIERLDGVLHYRDRHVTFEGCKGEHGPVKFLAEGFCNFPPDGRWKIHFAKLSADRLRADRELIQALPERLRKFVIELSPTGPINLRGSLDLERTGQPGEPLRSRWDVRLGMQQTNLRLGDIFVENVHGEVSLLGGFDGRRLQSRGKLALDSLTYKKGQFTRIAGPIWIDDGRVLFGEWVDRPNNGVVNAGMTGLPQSPSPLTASFCGGKFYALGWATHGSKPRYAVSATLTGADLARCAREMGVGHRNLRGKIIATANLSGSGRTRSTLSGHGTVRLSDSDVYELPVMIALLNILGIRTPDPNGFSDAEIDYNIKGEHIYFDRIDFHGDTISLRGKGEMDFQSAIRLTFYAMVGRGELDIPVIKQVFSGASQQIMLIHVDGTLHNPQTRKETLPVVNQVLQELMGEPPSRR